MRTSAGFQAHRANGKVGKKNQNILSVQLLVENVFSVLVHAVHLEFMLCDIKPNTAY
jgi:hypothetical protein